ncbi:hypothetical protein BH23GEM8_BH23GEM8_02950 [soil metagenome]
MSFRTVKHLCGHEARYSLAGGRALVEHHVHELERSPCTPCAKFAALARGHIYLGTGVRIVSIAETSITDPAPVDLRAAEDAEEPLPSP